MIELKDPLEIPVTIVSRDGLNCLLLRSCLTEDDRDFIHAAIRPFSFYGEIRLARSERIEAILAKGAPE